MFLSQSKARRLDNHARKAVGDEYVGYFVRQYLLHSPFGPITVTVFKEVGLHSISREPANT